MPVELPNGSRYKLCLLDTNALSEIVKRPSNEGRGYIERFPPNEFIPCFTPYSLFELHRHPGVFHKFVKFFNIYPALITKPFQHILELEVAAKGRAKVNDVLLCAFTPLGPDSSFELVRFIDNFLSSPEMTKLEFDSPG